VSSAGLLPALEHAVACFFRWHGVSSPVQLLVTREANRVIVGKNLAMSIGMLPRHREADGNTYRFAGVVFATKPLRGL
jgi:hypothetical protein